MIALAGVGVGAYAQTQKTADEPSAPKRRSEPPAKSADKQAGGAWLSPMQSQWTKRSNDVYSVFEAVRAQDAAVLEARVNEGESVNVKNEQGDTPLHVAAEMGSVQMVRMLLQVGSDPLAKNKKGKLASEVAKDEAVREACRTGEEPRRREIKVVEAVRAGTTDQVSDALKAGVDVNAKSEDNTSSLLTEAIMANKLDIVRVLVAAGADVHYIQPNSRGVLNLAAAVGNVEMLQLLISAGADPMVHTNHGAYPIHDAIWAGKTAAAIELIPYYQSINFSPDGKGNGYPIGMAIARGNTEVVRAFIRAGINVNAAQFNKEPLLVLAVKQNREEMVKLLLDAGADQKLKDASGKTAADYATGKIKEMLSK